MEDPFESARLCVETAEEFLTDFRDQSAAYHASRPVRIVAIRDPDTGDQLHSLQITEPPPRKLRARMGGAVTEMRNALDQATHAASTTLGTKHEDATYFPLLRDPSPESQSQIFHPRKGRCRGVALEIRPFLMALQPWPTSPDHEGGNNTIALLGRIAGPNKHRVTLTSAFAINSVSARNLKATNIRQLLLPPRFNDEMNRATFLRLAHDSTAEYEAVFGLNVVFGGSTGVTGKPVAAFLDQCLSEVKRIVSGMEAETARIIAARAA